jgi:hypothetical protein
LSLPNKVLASCRGHLEIHNGMDKALERIIRQGLEHGRTSSWDYLRQTEEAVRIYRSKRVLIGQRGEAASMETAAALSRKRERPNELEDIRKREAIQEGDNRSSDYLLDIPDFLRRT